MTEKEIAEIRRRLNHDKNNITKLRGCYVGADKKITAEFSQTVGLLSLEESENLFKILKKTLSGRLGRNLVDISFSTEQVSDSKEHKLLMRLKDSDLEDEEALHELYGKIIAAFPTEDDYIIFLGCDKYDVPRRSKNDETMPEESEDVFRYVLCSVCPVKSAQTWRFQRLRSALCFRALMTEARISITHCFIQEAYRTTIKALPKRCSIRNIPCRL